MTNSSDTFKTGEKADRSGHYACLNCREMGKSSGIALEEGEVIPRCETCGTGDATYRLTDGTIAG